MRPVLPLSMHGQQQQFCFLICCLSYHLQSICTIAAYIYLRFFPFM